MDEIMFDFWFYTSKGETNLKLYDEGRDEENEIMGTLKSVEEVNELQVLFLFVTVSLLELFL